MSQSYHGIGLGGGIGIGRARVLRAGLVDIPLHRFAPAQRDAEVARLHAAIDVVKADLQAVAAQLPADAPPEARALLDVHEIMLNDPSLGFGAQEKILDEGLNAQWAWSSQIALLVDQFNHLDDDYLRARSRDVEQIGQRVLMRLTVSASHDYDSDGTGEIIVAHDLDPTDLLKWRAAEGFAIDLGGVNSHTAIVARSLQRPSAIGLGTAAEQVSDGDLLILDGETGALIINPDAQVLEAYQAKQKTANEQALLRQKLIGVKAITLDGQLIGLQANIEIPSEAAAAAKLGADGIGLFRSEFLFLDRLQLPDEQEQYEAYCTALSAMPDQIVTIRTIDVGADKALPQQRIDPPANPALGQRAIRFSMQHPDIFITQLRALLRASACGNLRILVPMMAHRFEVDACKALIQQAREQLAQEGYAMADHVPLGAMIEVPAAAIEADWFARELDFLSIGTNDLVQYTLAVDRTDHQVARLYDSYHPAVLRLIQMTIDACNKHGKPLAVCGEMAGNPNSAELLVRMGLRHLSMQPQSLLAVKERLLQTDLTVAKSTEAIKAQ